MMLSPDWISFIYALNFPLNISQPVYLRQISQSLLWRLPSGSTLEKTFYGKPQAMLFIFYIYLWFFSISLHNGLVFKILKFLCVVTMEKTKPKIVDFYSWWLTRPPGWYWPLQFGRWLYSYICYVSLSLLSNQINPPIATCLWFPPGRNKSRRNRESYWNCSNSWSPRCPIQPRKWERFSEPERPCHLGSLWMWKHKRGGSVNI